VDCGVYALLGMIYLGLNIPLNFGIQNIPEARNLFKKIQTEELTCINFLKQFSYGILAESVDANPVFIKSKSVLKDTQAESFKSQSSIISIQSAAENSLFNVKKNIPANNCEERLTPLLINGEIPKLEIRINPWQDFEKFREYEISRKSNETNDHDLLISSENNELSSGSDFGPQCTDTEEEIQEDGNPELHIEDKKIPGLDDRKCRPPIDILEAIKVLEESGLETKLPFLLNGQSSIGGKRISFEKYHFADKTDLNYHCDVDSILYTANVLPITCDIFFYEFPNKESTLTKNYITWEVNQEPVPLTQLPHFKIASFGENSQFNIHIFLPSLRSKGNLGNRWVTYVNNVDMKDFYDQVWNPCIIATIPVAQHQHYRNDYETSLRISMKGNGKFSFSTKPMSKNFVPHFFVNLTAIAETTQKFKGIFYHIHAKGLKLSNFGTNVEVLDQIIDRYTMFDWQKMDLNNFYVDLGLELAPPDSSMTLVWDQRYCQDLLHRQLGMYKPNSHPYCLFNDIGGAAGAYTRQTSEFGQLLFVQMYMNDKELFYSFRENYFDSFTPQMILEDPKRVQAKIIELQKSLLRDSSTGSSFGVRIEFRAPFRYLRQNGHQLINLVTTQKNRVFCIPTKILCLLKVALAESTLDLMQQLDRFKVWDHRIVMANLVFIFFQTLLRAPDPVKMKYLSIILQDTDVTMNTFGRYGTENVDLQNYVIHSTPSLIAKGMPMFRKWFKKLFLKNGKKVTLQGEAKCTPNVPMVKTMLKAKPVTTIEQLVFSNDMPASTALSHCLTEIIGCIPGVGSLFLELGDWTKVTITNFQKFSEEKNISNQVKLVKARKWDRFARYFPSNDLELSQFFKRQHTKNLKYPSAFVRWWSNAQEVTKREFTSLFDQVTVLPDSEPAKFYIKKKQFYFVFKQ
jgi:hypothetical protein